MYAGDISLDLDHLAAVGNEFTIELWLAGLAAIKIPFKIIVIAAAVTIRISMAKSSCHYNSQPKFGMQE